ncbi:MAG: zinc-dependent alcohol dehydrogenase family protein [Gammaproteobacteria bacterium]
MRAMLLTNIAEVAETTRPLHLHEMPDPLPAAHEILLEVRACGVCHTELDEIEGRLAPPKLPLIPGHQVVGTVTAVGEAVTLHKPGERVGVGWIAAACGTCRYCREGNENLCAAFQATGLHRHGGYAEKMTVHERFAYALPQALSDTQAAPLLCAGAIGYRSLRLTGLRDGDNLGLTGFGGSAHLVLQMARHRYPRSPVYVFARSAGERAFAQQLGAAWAGDTRETPPQPLHAIIDTTPAWLPVVEALRNLAPGGRLVINAIRKESGDRDVLLTLDYADHLWREKEIKSVANVARNDVAEFLHLAAQLQIKPEVETYPLAEANRALRELKSGRIRGAKVLLIGA